MKIFKPQGSETSGELVFDEKAFEEACSKLVNFCDVTLDLSREEGFMVLRAVTNGLADLLQIPESERLMKNSPARFIK